ncbi:MAG: alpha-L-fucosidase, partial [Bacteroidales bacterium]|nr:alpha-L-fucosidase [Bacteroidales bacterium]
PKSQINHPWESCITLTDSWGWVPDANFKSSRKVIGILAEIVAKGGCLVLGVGPTPEGLIEDRAVGILDEIGEWLSRCGQAIYSTRTVENYNEGNIWFTRSKDGKDNYAVFALEDGKELPSEIAWSGNLPKGKVTILNTGKTVRPVIKDGNVTLKLPKGLSQEPVALKF